MDYNSDPNIKAQETGPVNLRQMERQMAPACNASPIGKQAQGNDPKQWPVAADSRSTKGRDETLILPQYNPYIIPVPISLSIFFSI